MSIAPSLLKNIFSVLIVVIFSISLLVFGVSNLQSKEAKAFDFNKFLDKCNSNNYYSNYSSTKCDILSQSITCLIDTCSIDGVNPDSTINNCASGYYRANSRQCLSLYSTSQYQNCNDSYYSLYSNNNCNNSFYTVYSPSYNNCINCFEQAISQLQNGANSFNLGNADINSNLLNEITNSGRTDIPTSISSYVSGNTTYTEIKNYSGAALSSASFSIDNNGTTTINNSSNSTISPNCYRNINLYICDSFVTTQLANQFGSYGSISVPYRSTFTITPTQNNNIFYNNVNYNPPIYDDYYYDYGYEDCNNSLFGCGY